MTVTEIPFIATFSQDTDEATPTLETDKSKTDTPTIYLSATEPVFYRGRILEIGYRLNPTNAVTYTFMIFEKNIANNYESNSRMLYESAAARVDDTDYRIECDIPFNLWTAGRFYIATDWTAAAGNTTGYLRIAGIGYVM